MFSIAGCRAEMPLNVSGKVSEKNSHISRIEDIDQLNEVISITSVTYSNQDYKNYTEKEIKFREEYGFKATEKLDEKLNFKIYYKSDDYKVAGYICAPGDYLEKDYPILIFVRGGNQSFAMVSPASLAAYTNDGFIILATQYRGNDGGTGKEDFGGDDVQDIISLIDIAEQLSFGNGKVYILGGSRGGLETYCTLKQESAAGRDRISAAVVIAGVSNLTDLYYFRDETMKGTLIDLVGGTPEQLPEEYERRSAICWPEAIHTPLLIIHGKTDMRAPVEQAEIMYDKLIELGKDTELRLYEVGHDDLPPESKLEAYEWLKSY